MMGTEFASSFSTERVTLLQSLVLSPDKREMFAAYSFLEHILLIFQPKVSTRTLFELFPVRDLGTYNLAQKGLYLVNTPLR